MELENLKLDVTDLVATVTLDRPPVNALGRAIREEMIRVFDALHDREDVRAVVLTGSGTIFCAGADITDRSLMTGEPGEHVKLNRLVREVFYSVMECSKPVIAAVNGPALGAGFVLTLCCDILLAADGAIFAMPEVDVGLAGGVKFLQRHLTPSKARRLLLTGQRIPAPELYRLGVLEECMPGDQLLATAAAIAREIASKSPLAIQMLKQSLNTVEPDAARRVPRGTGHGRRARSKRGCQGSQAGIPRKTQTGFQRTLIRGRTGPDRMSSRSMQPNSHSSEDYG
jgi:enoyl-CoA hydratase